VNAAEEPGNACSCPFGISQPELTYFMIPIIVYEGLGGVNSFTPPYESITVGINDLALTAITTLFLPGTLSGSLLEFGGIAQLCRVWYCKG
jgi:hypothetical protein